MSKQELWDEDTIPNGLHLRSRWASSNVEDHVFCIILVSGVIDAVAQYKRLYNGEPWIHDLAFIDRFTGRRLI